MREKFEEALKSLNLKGNEIKIILNMISLKPKNATEISKITKIQRPNTYDLLASIEEKGFIKKIIINNQILYKLIDPNELIELAKFHKKEYEKKMNEIINFSKNLKKSKNSEEEINIEIYKGFKGARIVLFSSLEETKKTNKEILGIGVRNYNFLKEDPIYYERYMKEREKIKLKSRYLLYKGEKIFSHRGTKTRTLSKTEKNPVALYIYGDITSIWLWYKEPIIIVIKNKDISESNRNYFEYLWKMALVKPL